jgi:enoyl-CoA hydratase
MATYNAFALSYEGHVAHLQLNRPDALNTMNSDFWRELPQALREIEDSAARVAVLSSTGKHFTAGMDLAVFASVGGDIMGGNPSRTGEAFRRLVFELQDVFNALERLRIPVLAAVQGGCIGGGVDMVSACDCRYATANAFFSIKETQLAMTADVGTLQRLPHLIPHGMVREMAYTGNPLTAERAKAIGLVNEVYPDQAAMLAGVMAIANDIAKNSPLAVHGSKQMITYARDHSVADSLNFIATWQAGMFSPGDMQETFVAKAEKREPKFDPLLPNVKKMT